MRVNADGQRGDGPLYAMGINFSMTGVFYNKELAAKIGMTEAPKTLDEFDADLKAAKAAGITPMAQFNGGATGGLAFPLQALMAVVRQPERHQLVDLPACRCHDRHSLEPQGRRAPRQTWIKAGYFAKDINSMDYSQMMSRFIGGESLFIFDGDWESGNLDKQMAGNAGILPHASARPRAASSAPCPHR